MCRIARVKVTIASAKKKNIKKEKKRDTKEMGLEGDRSNEEGYE